MPTDSERLKELCNDWKNASREAAYGLGWILTELRKTVSMDRTKEWAESAVRMLEGPMDAQEAMWHRHNEVLAEIDAALGESK